MCAELHACVFRPHCFNFASCLFISSDAALMEYREASPFSMSISFFKRNLFQLCTYVVALFAKPLWFSYVIHAFGFRVSGYKLLWRRIRR